MNKVVIFFFFVLLATRGAAQNITNVDFHQVGDEIVITYNLDDSCPIGAYVSLDGGKSYKEMRSIRGDVGKSVLPGKKRMLWRVLYDIPEGLAGQVQLKVSTNLFVSVDGIEFEMVYVKGGDFLMGGTLEQGDDYYHTEKPIHSVTLSDYYIGKYEVTQGLWEKVMGSKIERQWNKELDSIIQWSKELCITYEECCEMLRGMTMEQFRNLSSFNGIGFTYPMYYVSWNEAWEFCKKLTQLTGKKCTLPTEAQWEYAARGGVKSKGYKYSGSNDIDEVAWYGENSKSGTHPIGTKEGNELGIYDMIGNVWEFCSDWYGRYISESQTNPTGASLGSDRVSRGGSWKDDARDCRVSGRNFPSPDIRKYNHGFRVVLLP